ncbi:MAG TPA: hypothetical protein ENJ82_02825 [Bacteroidetes bacterium]|nr:hypothetical protein [Bacteroidota bacterium]
MYGNVPSKKKPCYPINSTFQDYLARHGRHLKLPLQYQDLRRFTLAFPLEDRFGKDTLWKTVHYEPNEMADLNYNLTLIYSLLKTGGEDQFLQHLSVARIDFCTFGNSNPFRIRIINRLNDNYDHFYIKQADASRLYGLELEHILSPNKMLFLVDKETLIEEHIAGIPGDEFMANQLEGMAAFDEIRLAKEFVKFNERCFARLLGDMRAYNYVVDITPDIEGSQFRLQAIDFDQQSYEGRKSFYLPQFFKENNPIIDLGIKHMNHATVRQYQLEERSMIASRIRSEEGRYLELMDIMREDQLSSVDKVLKLGEELAKHHKTELFKNCRTMGALVAANIQLLLAREFRQSISS